MTTEVCSVRCRKKDAERPATQKNRGVYHIYYVRGNVVNDILSTARLFGYFFGNEKSNRKGARTSP